MLIDTHCHLNFPDKFPDPEKSIEEARLAGVDRLIVVGCNPETSRRAVELANAYAGVYAVVGWHPTYTKDYTRESLEEIEQMLTNSKVVAIGEIGLDFHWDFSTLEQQTVALMDQMDLAVRKKKPVVFHAREAYPELLDVLEQRPIHPYLFHCFAGDATDAQRALALGALFGVDGPITYKNAGELRAVIGSIPHDRLVIETDSPYLPPVPFRGHPNKPAYIVHINNALAGVLGISPEECAKLTTVNAEKFFGLP